MNQQPVKRKNPFDIPRETRTEEKQTVVEEPTMVRNDPIIEEDLVNSVLDDVEYVQQAISSQQTPINQQQYIPQQQYYTPTQGFPQQQHSQKVVKSNQKRRYDIPEEVVRDKFTSTMDRTLRRNIKIVCAQRGIMFAQFVEDACREKLAKEGFR